MNSIPPQAYTRDVLVKAIEWIQTQPQSLREKATTADLLVSFYKQACRQSAGITHGGRDAATLEAPVSQENFKADLKNLAEGLRQFEEPSAPPTHPGRFPSYTNDLPKVEPLFTPAPQPEHHYIPRNQPPPLPPPLHEPRMRSPHYVPHAHSAPHHPENQSSYGNYNWTVDARSLAAAKDLQQRLNFSNEGEALRMLISLGLQRARELFP